MQYNFGHIQQWFESEEALNSAIEEFVEQKSSWCTVDYTSTPQTPVQQWSTGGIVTVEHYRPGFAVTAHDGDCTQGWTYSPTTRRNRELSCPKGGWVLVYDDATGVKPYCACPAGTVCDPPVSYQGAFCKGNPCVVSTGVKYQVEHDYQAGGLSPLAFKRAYNSRYAKNYYNGNPGVNPPRLEPLGVGWAADYLQRVVYDAQGQYAGLWAFRPDGSVLGFVEQADGSFTYSGELADRVQRDIVGGNTAGWKYTTAADDVERYDLSGRLVSITRRGGVTQVLSYGASGLLDSVADSFGNRLQFSWNANRQLQALILPDQSQIAYTFDANQNLVGVSYPDARGRTYHYGLTGSSVNLLTGITDESGTRLATYAYNTSGNVTSSEHAGGVNRYAISYNGNSRTVTDPLGTARTHTGQVIRRANRLKSTPSTCSGCSEPKFLDYDAQGNITKRRDFQDIETRYAYDTARSLETSRTEGLTSTGAPTARARVTTTAWHSAFRLPTQVSVYAGDVASGTPLRTTSFSYDANGNVLTRTVSDPATGSSRARTWTYDSLGRVLTEDGPRNDVSDVTTYAYYSCTSGYRCGQLQSVTNALGQVTSYDSYNAHAQPLSITDSNGVITTLTYDARQRLTSRNVGGETTSLEYWPTGLLKRVSLPDGTFLAYTYDGAQRLVRLDNSAGEWIAYVLDPMGNRTAESTYDPSGALLRTHSRVFNSLNQLWKDVNAAGTAAVTTTFGFDANGNPTSTSAPLGRTTSLTYDELNRLTRLTDPLSGATAYSYDALDHLTGVTDPRNLLTSYQYDGLGDLRQLSSPDTGVTTYAYDEAGNLSNSTDARGATASYGYDVLNRVTTIDYGDRMLTFGYDSGPNGTGRLTTAGDPSHGLSWTYDALGRVTGKGQTVSGVTLAVGHGYTSGRLTSQTLPSGQVVTYGYDAAGRLSSVSVNGSPVLSDVLYEPFGGTAGWRWGNGSYCVRTHDLDGRITQVDSGGLKTYAYDNASRITGLTDTTDPANSWTYGYDLLDRLTSASSTSVTQGWSYDANGNRLSETGTTPSTFNVAAGSNRLLAMTGTLPRNYSYDAAGNTTGYSGAAFTYDNRGRMVTATYGAYAVSYVYNALGQRVKRVGPTGTTLYVYDEGGHLLGEYGGSGALIQETIWLRDIPVATLRPNGASVDVYYVHTDHLNTPRLITRPADHAERWRWDSDPFGTTLPDENPAGLGAFRYDLRFPGQLYDGLVGLHHNYFRDYDPAIGRYVESDPIGLEGGVNTYAYVLDPLRSVDPFGLAGEFGGDTITQRILALIRGGRTEELKDLLEAGALNPQQEALAQRGLTRAGDLIRGGLRRSKSYHSELEHESYAEICKLASGRGELAKRASQMKKLIEQAERLQGKGY